MTALVVLSVIDIVLLIAGLAFYLFVVGGQLTRIATNLEECAEIVRTDRAPTPSSIDPGVEHINRTGGVVAGALPLLYGMAEGIVAGVTSSRPRRRAAAGRPASGRRRSRLHDGVGYAPGERPRPRRPADRLPAELSRRAGAIGQAPQTPGRTPARSAAGPDRVRW